MKSHRWFAVFLLFVLSVPAQAQGKFFIGATGGLSRMSLSGDTPDDASYTAKTGFSAGLIGEYALTADIHLSLQPSYTSRGTGIAYDVGEADPRDSLSLRLDYLSVPVMARFLSAGGFWFVNGGFDLSFLLDASLEDVNAGGTKDVTSALNSVDLMMLVGVGGIVNADPVRITLELRFSQGLINAGSGEQLSEAYGIPTRFRYSGFQLLVGVILPL